jgi:hypothetical protein
MVSRAADRRRRATACWTAWLPIAGPDAAFISASSRIRSAADGALLLIFLQNQNGAHHRRYCSNESEDGTSFPRR